MGTVIVDQIGPDGALVQDVDTTLSAARRTSCCSMHSRARRSRGGWRASSALRGPGHPETQVTHLGNPWQAFKKRIQIPKYWLDVETARARRRSHGAVRRHLPLRRRDDLRRLRPDHLRPAQGQQLGRPRLDERPVPSADTRAVLPRGQERQSAHQRPRRPVRRRTCGRATTAKNPHIDVFDRFSEAVPRLVRGSTRWTAVQGDARRELAGQVPERVGRLLRRVPARARTSTSTGFATSS